MDYDEVEDELNPETTKKVMKKVFTVSENPF